jgi:hypothetical protein
MKRNEQPSLNDLESALQKARQCIGDGRHFFGPNVNKIVHEFIELNIDHSNDIWILLAALLDEVTTSQLVVTPFLLKAIEMNLNCEILTFMWDSQKLKHRMYLKFAISNDTFYYFSLRKIKDLQNEKDESEA